MWVLDGDPGHTDLLRFALNEETFPHTLVILTVTMTAPWGILEQLQHWASVLADHLDKLKLDVDARQARRFFLHGCLCELFVIYCQFTGSIL